MSFFNERFDDFNTVAIEPSQAAVPPKVGFLGAFQASYEAQMRANSQFGMEAYFEAADLEQAYRLRKEGLSSSSLYEDPDAAKKLPIGMPRYKAIAKAIVDGDDPEAVAILKRRDTELKALQEQRPELGIRTYTEMFREIQQKAADAEKRAAEDTTAAGTAGWLLGGMAGAMNPTTDPLNFFTLGIGGVGRGILTKATTEGAAQGAIEGVNQLTGVAENRRLLGLDEANIGANIALAAGGGFVLRGAGEGLARWFRSTPADPAPELPATRPVDAVPEPEAPSAPPTPETPPAAGVAAGATPRIDLFARPDLFDRLIAEQSPLGKTRLAQARTIFDADYATRTLDAWDGPRPWEMAPASATRIMQGEQIMPAPDTVRATNPGETIDDIARRLDPDVFNAYDKLVGRKRTFQRWINELKDPRERMAAAKVAEMDAEILRLRMRIPEATKRNAKKYEARIAEILPERDAIFQSLVTRDTPDMQRVRKELMKVDEQMRDMAPVVSRAYARAEGKFVAYDQQRADIARMMAEGRAKVAPNTLMVDDPDAPAAPVARPLTERAPILTARPDVVEKLPADADAADIADAVIAENMKVLDEAIDAYRSSVGRVLKEAEEVDPETGKVRDTIEYGGQTINLNDEIVIPQREGEGSRTVTVRQLLAETDEDNDIMRAVTTCSVP